MQVHRRVRRRPAIVRQEVKRLSAIAEKRAAVEGARSAPSFRPLAQDGTEAISSADLLAALGPTAGVPSF